MGRIDEAMIRANLDAGRGTGAEAPAPAPSPWQIDHRESGDAAEAEGAPAIEAAAGTPVRRPLPENAGRPARWGGFAPEALERLVASKTAGALLLEQFRSLAATLLRLQAERHLKSVIVTSASPGDGKSHVSVNLALTLSDSYRRRVLLIDADLRKPTLHKLFRVPNTRGLSEALNGQLDEKAAVVQTSETLTLLPAGRTEANPLGGLSSDRIKRLVSDAAARFDWVIVDSPPVGVLADARLVSETVDAALLVVRAGVTQFSDLQAAADAIGHDRILGLVLNAVDPAEIRGQHYYRHYYGSGSQQS
jgi:protein-tyrosine kinase